MDGPGDDLRHARRTDYHPVSGCALARGGRGAHGRRIRRLRDADRRRGGLSQPGVGGGRGILGGLDESPQVYRRMPDVLAAQERTIEVLDTLRPLIVVMAGADEFDLYKD